jgi:hypothetical protein
VKKVAALLLLIASVASAQIRPPGSTLGRPPARPDSTVRDTLSRRDTLRGRPAAGRADTTKGDTVTVVWPPADSVMKALAARTGYDVTRFQAARATYDANSKDLRLDAGKDQRAAVDRDGQTMASDSTIYYNEATNTTTNEGCYVLNFPGSTEAPIKGCGKVTYDASNRGARFTNARAPFNNGEMWYLQVTTGAAQVDTAADGKLTLYMRGGRITSCPDSIPDYYFSGKTMKRTPNGTVIARNVVLYIGDVPTLWLPFIFQNVKSGRVSGLLTARFGISDIIRNSPTYHRNIENFGYYWAMNDYMDATTWIDWRSGSGGLNANDPGWLKLNGRWDYNWLGRFLSGSLATNYWFMGNGTRNFGLTWGHQQQFSNDGRLTLDINYVTDTKIQRQNTFDPYQSLATISSQANYSRKIGPASLSLGGSRRQYPGRPQVDQTFPTLQISTAPINMGKHLTWSPTFSYTSTASLNIDRPSIFQVRYNPSGTVDSLKRSEYSTAVSFNSPLKIFEQDFSNSFSLRSSRRRFPELVTIYDVTSGDSLDSRVFGEVYQTDLDWTPTFSLPPMRHNRWNLTPGIALANVDPGAFWVATERSNGRFVSQAKRLSYSLSATPTFYGLFRGFGPFGALRHTVTPSFGYTYAPAAHVSDEYLEATRRSRKGYLGAIRLNQINFGLNTSLEARLAGDSTRGGGKKVKILGLTMSPFNYNLERLNAPEVTSTKWWRGLTTERFTYSVTSDLLPGVQFSSDYSLFQGSSLSDTAVFSPYREQTQASVSFSRDANPFAMLTKLFGKAVPPAEHAPVAPVDPSVTSDQEAAARELAGAPVAGARTSGDRFLRPPTGGWRLALTLSSARQRPPKGGNVIVTDPATICRNRFPNDQIALTACLDQASLTPTEGNTTGFNVTGAPVYLSPPTTNIGANLGFSLTPRWTVQWNTNYDAQRHEFAMHTVNLQRDLHDWRANFGFTQSVNGNFAFNFSIGLKAQPDLKFDYNRNSIRSQPF